MNASGQSKHTTTSKISSIAASKSDFQKSKINIYCTFKYLLSKKEGTFNSDKTSDAGK